MKSLLCIVVFFAAFAFAIPDTCLAQDIPAEMRASFYTKVFSFVRSLDNPHVSIIYAEKEAKRKDALAKEFQKLGVTVNSFVESDAAKADGNVMYLLSGVSDDTAQHFSTCGTLVLADSRALVEAGYVTFVLAPHKGKVKLWANLAHIKNNELGVNSAVLKASNIVG